MKKAKKPVWTHAGFKYEPTERVKIPSPASRRGKFLPHHPQLGPPNGELHIACRL